MALKVDILKKALEDSSREELLSLIIQQALRLAAVEEENSVLRQRVEELEQAAHRQAAPFRIDEKRKVKSRKRSGQSKGHKGHYRHCPEQVDQRIKVPIPAQCPSCGSRRISRIRRRIQFIEEIVEQRPYVTELTTYEGLCEDCGSEVESSHPLQVSRAVGAAATHLGPLAQATALRMQYHYGLSKRKTTGMLSEFFGLRLSPGGVVHLTHRTGQAFSAEYNRLLEQARKADYLHVDETSWYVDGPKHQLWVFTHPTFTLYRVVKSRSREELRAVIGSDFKGVLVSDCLAIYDDVCKHQQKCYAHHLKFIGDTLRKCPNEQNPYLEQVKELLLAAMRLKKEQQQMLPKDFEYQLLALEQQAQLLFPIEKRDNEWEEKVRLRLFKQRDHLFTFLYFPAVDATNNLAERQLRPAVIARKISCGNRTQKGAITWQINASLIVSNQQHQHSPPFNQLLHFALRRRAGIEGR